MRALAWALGAVVACGRPPAPPGPPPPEDAAAPEAPAPLAASAPPATSAAPPPAPATLDLRVRKTSPVRCNAGQTNVPCVYKKGAGCLLRRANCDQRPCEEGPHEPIACDATVAPLAKPTKVCLDILGVKDLIIEVLKEDATRGGGYGPVSRDHIRMCAHDPADRPWRIDGVGTLDWSKEACFTLDAGTKQLRAGCGSYDGVVIEGRL